jgi:ribonuclease HI
MELTAAIRALQWLWEKYSGKSWTWSEENVQDWFFAAEQPSVVVIDEHITLITDSSYVKLGITEWMVTRKRRLRRRAKGAKLVENVGLRKQLDALVTCFPNLERQRTKAHVGTELNERVDQLAREQASKYS